VALAAEGARAMLIVRACRAGDFAGLMDLARASGPGFTSLPDDEAAIAERLAQSLAAYRAAPDPAVPARYLLILEDVARGAIVGVAAVKAHAMTDRPFFNFRVLTIGQASFVANRRFDMRLLVLTNEYSGATEVGSLFLAADARGGGIGRFLAQSRYLLIASDPARFSKTVFAELRGVVDADGQSPFWEGLGAKFFRMSFVDADKLTGTTEGQFILDLMPRTPIYADLLSAPAQAAIGACHPEGAGAKKLLEWEGFAYDHVVDIFDGGPLVACPRDSIRTLRESAVYECAIGNEALSGNGLAARVDFGDFRALRTSVAIDEGRAVIGPAAAAALGLSAGDPIRVWSDKS